MSLPYNFDSFTDLLKPIIQTQTYLQDHKTSTKYLSLNIEIWRRYRECIGSIQQSSQRAWKLSWVEEQGDRRGRKMAAYDPQQLVRELN